MTCPYKNLLGEPGKGVHSFRIAGIAVADVLLTILISWLFAKITKMPFWASLLIWLLLGQIMHVLFCVDTSLTKFLGLATTTKNG